MRELLKEPPKPSRHRMHDFIQPPSLLVCVFKALFHTVSAQEMMHGEEELPVLLQGLGTLRLRFFACHS